MDGSLMAQATNSPKQNEKGKFFGYLQIVLVLAAILILLFLARAPARFDPAISDGQSSATVPPPAVSVIEQPQQQDFTHPIELTGNVSLEERVAVTSEARGRIVWISENFRSGKTIPANEPIVKTDPAEYQLAVRQAEARLRNHVAMPESSPDDAAAEFLKAQLELAERKLAQTEISLPYDLLVIRADVEVGELTGPFEYVGADASLLGIGYRPEALQVTAPLEPHHLETLNPLPGRAATINVENKVYDANLELVVPLVSPETRMITVTFKFAEDSSAPPLPLPGMFAEITLDGPTYENALVLPIEALQRANTAWVVENGAVAVRSPNTLVLTKQYWVVEPFDVAEGLIVGAYPGLAAGTAVSKHAL